jgi:hypothetical protein
MNGSKSSRESSGLDLVLHFETLCDHELEALAGTAVATHKPSSCSVPLDAGTGDLGKRLRRFFDSTTT